MSFYEDDIPVESIKDTSPFFGQIGPVYLFNDAMSPDQVRGIYSLGPSYMYSFLDNEAVPSSDNLVPSGILDIKDGLASRIIFGINAQVLFVSVLFLLFRFLFSVFCYHINSYLVVPSRKVSF